MSLTNIKPARGHVTPEGDRQIAIRFTQETSDAIAKQAHSNGRSFAAQVLYYVGLGMDRDRAA